MDVKNIGQGSKADLDNYINKQEVQKVNNVVKKEDQKDDIKEKGIKEALERLNRALAVENTHAEYSVHEKLGDIMIKIVNDDTNEIIKEIPPKKILDLVAKMCEDAGLIFDKKV